MIKIITPVIVKALKKFFSLFGFLKVVQTDQGSNFILHESRQVLKQIKFDTVIPVHVTLRVMAPLSTFRAGGGHLQMFAIRGVVQVSLGFSPSELVYAYTVSGPLKLWREKWFCEGTEQSLLDNVSNFRVKLCCVELVK